MPRPPTAPGTPHPAFPWRGTGATDWALPTGLRGLPGAPRPVHPPASTVPPTHKTQTGLHLPTAHPGLPASAANGLQVWTGQLTHKTQTGLHRDTAHPGLPVSAANGLPVCGRRAGPAHRQPLHALGGATSCPPITRDRFDCSCTPKRPLQSPAGATAGLRPPRVDQTTRTRHPDSPPCPLVGTTRPSGSAYQPSVPGAPLMRPRRFGVTQPP